MTSRMAISIRQLDRNFFVRISAVNSKIDGRAHAFPAQFEFPVDVNGLAFTFA